MPFPERVRRYHERVQGNRCQQEVYSERRGWTTCGKTDVEDDHIEPEAWMLQRGRDPNNESHGILRCRTHHRGRGRVNTVEPERVAYWGEENYSRHPDMGDAQEAYRRGDREAFVKAGKLHEARAKRGIRYWNGDEGTDRHEAERVEEMEWKHFLTTGETRPKVKPHKDIVKKKKWYEGLF